MLRTLFLLAFLLPKDWIISSRIRSYVNLSNVWAVQEQWPVKSYWATSDIKKDLWQPVSPLPTCFWKKLAETLQESWAIPSSGCFRIRWIAPLEMFVSACVPPSTEFGKPRQLPEESEIPSMECRHQGRNSYQKLNSKAHIFRAVFFPICVINELWLLITSQEKLQISRQIKKINRFESILLLRLFLGKINLLIVIQKDLPRSLTVLF